MIRHVIVIILILLLVCITLYVKRSKYRISENTNVGNSIIQKMRNKFSLIFFADLWNPDGKDWKHKNSIDYAKEWLKMKPEISNILRESKIFSNKKYENKGVIHFRCSDVPFNKHKYYNLLPKEYYLFALQKMEEQRVDEIVFLNCSDWNSKYIENTDQKCNSYISTIADWLQEKTKIKVNREKICIPVKETYEIMLGSKVLVGSGGSFSFIPGMLKGKNFITPSNIGEGNLELFKKFKNLHKEVHWTMWGKFDRISHNGLDYKTFDYKNYEVNSSFKVDLTSSLSDK